MGLGVTIYLYKQRLARTFPRFVIYQLFLIITEYTIATGLSIWTVVHVFKAHALEKGRSPSNEEIFLKITYPMNEVMNIMFLSYNWLYVNQYLKAALLLPIMLSFR